MAKNDFTLTRVVFVKPIIIAVVLIEPVDEVFDRHVKRFGQNAREAFGLTSLSPPLLRSKVNMINEVTVS